MLFVNGRFFYFIGLKIADYSLSRNQRSYSLAVNMKDDSKLIVNLISGLAVGAFIGLLLAPGKGKSSRNKVDLFFTNLTDTFVDHAENHLNLLGNLKDGLKYSIKQNMNARSRKS
jgi:gas vesicle protein